MKKYLLSLIIVLIFSSLVFGQSVWLLSDEGIGLYKYLEKDATTHIHYGTDILPPWQGYQAFVNYQYHPVSYQHSSGSDYHFSSSNISGSWSAGTMISFTVAVFNPYTSHTETDYAKVIDITTSTSGLASSLVDNPSGTENLVMSFKIDAGGSGESLKRLWIKNNGTAQEGSDIPESGIILYYEDASVSMTYDGTETNSHTLDDYNNNSTSSDELWGDDRIDIVIPSGGLMCHLVVTDLVDGFNAAHTVNFALVEDGMNLTNGLVRIDETVSGGGDAPLPVSLSSFSAELNGDPTIRWTTQSESNNAYWNVYRSISQNLGQASWLNADEMIEGAGTTAEPTDYVFIDLYGVEETFTYYYWIECVDNAGETDIYGPVSLFIPEGIVNNGTPAAPSDYGLKQNFPNPFNPDTRISFALEDDGPAQITIYNLKGNKIRTIFDEIVEADMVQSAYWDGTDENGKTVATGVYLYRLRTNSTSYTKRMLLMK
jgi:hypothetical protein